jgi:hypothetical protein
MESWYLSRGGTVYGPFTQEQMLHMVKTGHLVPDDIICPKSSPEWVIAHTDTRLFPDIRFPCPSCGKVLKAGFKLAGRRAKCRCGEAVQIPGAVANGTSESRESDADRPSQLIPHTTPQPEEQSERVRALRLGRLDKILSVVAPLAVLALAAYTVVALFAGPAKALWVLFIACSFYGSVARFLVSRWRPRIAFTLMKSTVTVDYGEENGQRVRYVARVETLLDRIGNIFIAALLGFMTWLVAWCFLESYFAYRSYTRATSDTPNEQWSQLSKEPNTRLSVGVVLATLGLIMLGAWIESR